MFASILFIFGFAFFILFIYALSKKRNVLAVPFSFMCLSAAIYIVGYGFELLSTNVSRLIFALKAEYFGVPFMVAFWLVMTLQFVEKKQLSSKSIGFIMVIPIITLFLSASNEYHHLVYKSITTIEYQGFLLSQFIRGPWYFLHVAYCYGIIAYSMIIFFRAWYFKKNQYHTQAFWLFVGSIWPLAVNIIYIAGFVPFNLDLTPFGLGIAACFFYIAIFKYGFLDFQDLIKDVTFLDIDQGILVLDSKNRLIDYNHACEKVFQWLKSIPIGTHISVAAEGQALLEQSMYSRFEMRLSRENSLRFYDVQKNMLHQNDHDYGMVYFIQDVTKSNEMIRALNQAANYDYLMDIYNRRMLIEVVEIELKKLKKYSGCLSVLMIDIDHFKIVNDIYGHQAGDDVLSQLAKMCKTAIHRSDVIGRYGGEELLILLPKTDEKKAYLIAENIRKSIADWDFSSNKELIHITVSIGIKTIHSDDSNTDLEELIRGADKALYQAKNGGRNKSVIWSIPV